MTSEADGRCAGKGTTAFHFPPLRRTAATASLCSARRIHAHPREARSIIPLGSEVRLRGDLGREIMSMVVSGGEEDGGGGGGGRPRPRRHHGEQRSGVATVVEGTMDSSPVSRYPLPPRLAALRCLVPKILVSTL